MAEERVETPTEETKFKAPARKKKNKKKIGCAVAAAVAIAAVLGVLILPRLLLTGGNAPAVYSGDAVTVTVRDVFDTVSATGLVESDEDTTARVYSTLSYKIDRVFVSVGDMVQQDTVLAQYETETLERAIKERELSAGSAKKASALNLASAKLNYDTFAAGVADGTNSTLVAANSTLANAQENYDSAKKDYDTYIAKLDASTVVELNQAKRNLDTAQKDYDKLKAEIAGETNIQLRDAKRALADAQKDYDDYKALVDKNETSTLFTSYMQYVTAKETWRDAHTAMKDAEVALKAAEKTDDPATIASAQAAYNAAVSAEKAADRAYGNADESYEFAKENEARTLEKYKTVCDKAQTAYDDVLKSLNDTLEKYENALISAEEAYLSAAEAVDNRTDAYARTLRTAERNLSDSTVNLENAKITVNNQLESYRVSYESAKLNADTSLTDYQLSNLRRDLEKATVKAPISGTVTAVYATEGETAAGVMFVIEDTANLVITSTVKAYDLESVREGMEVLIKTDSTGDKEYHGVLESIAPTAQKGTNGVIISSTDAAFDTVIRVTDADERLRIGLSARVSYVLGGGADALAAPSTAILSDGEGAFVLAISEEDGTGRATLVRTAVTVGASDGVYTQILSGVDAGQKIADNAANYLSLVGQTFDYSDIDESVTDEDPFAKMTSGRIERGSMGSMTGGAR